jgi:hypothetical protein
MTGGLIYAGLYLRIANVLSLQALGPAFHLELYLRTFLERAVSVHLDRREVHEHIIAVRALDETIALCGVKPFHNTFFSHYLSPVLDAEMNARPPEQQTKRAEPSLRITWARKNTTS